MRKEIEIVVGRVRDYKAIPRWKRQEESSVVAPP